MAKTAEHNFFSTKLSLPWWFREQEEKISGDRELKE